MQLEGSCHCGKVKFTVESAEPVPFMRCYCSICRKTAGAGGYAINLGADARSMKVTGKRYLRIYRARLPNDSGTGTHLSSARRHFCARCGSALWVWDPTWPGPCAPPRQCDRHAAAGSARERALPGRLQGTLGEYRGRTQ